MFYHNRFLEGLCTNMRAWSINVHARVFSSIFGLRLMHTCVCISPHEISFNSTLLSNELKFRISKRSNLLLWGYLQKDINFLWSLIFNVFSTVMHLQSLQRSIIRERSNVMRTFFGPSRPPPCDPMWSFNDPQTQPNQTTFQNIYLFVKAILIKSIFVYEDNTS